MAAFMPRAPRLRRGLLLADIAGLAAAIWAAHRLRFGNFDLEAKWRELLAHPGLLVTAALALLAISVAAELHEPLSLRRRREAVFRVAATAVLWATAIAVLTYLVPAWKFGRGVLLLTASLWAILAAVVRLTVVRRLQDRTRPPALVVGQAEAVAEVRSRLARHPAVPWEPIDAAALASETIPGEVARLGAEVVIIAGGETTADGLVADLAALHFTGVPVVVASEVFAWSEGRLPLDELSPASFFHQPGFRAVHWELFNRLTRVLDVLAAVVLLIVTAPLFLLTALAVLVFDGRPVLYRQKRLGQFGRPFTIYKLRTMRRDAEEEGPAFAAEDDPRATRLGRLLRRLRFDELPQLWNVLRGDMSLVGPRPERPEFAAQLARAIPYYTFRLAVPPGLTGWAQVNLRYARTEAEHRTRLEYDLYFIRERSVVLYLLTLLRTASVALFGVRG